MYLYIKLNRSLVIKQSLLAKGAFQLVEEGEEELEDQGGESGYESDDELDVDDEEDEELEDGEEGSGRPRNDPEWQFFDTAKVFVKAGDGGECVLACLMRWMGSTGAAFDVTTEPIHSFTHLLISKPILSIQLSHLTPPTHSPHHIPQATAASRSAARSTWTWAGPTAPRAAGAAPSIYAATRA
jgi:hypothetical protein